MKSNHYLNTHQSNMYEDKIIVNWLPYVLDDTVIYVFPCVCLCRIENGELNTRIGLVNLN